MLTPAQLELLTASVDGELTPPQRKALRQLLAANPEAAILHRQFQADATKLRSMPAVKAPATIAASVMARIPALPLAQPRPATPTRKLLNWQPIAIAASILFAVTVGSFAYFSNSRDPDRHAARTSWLPAPNTTLQGPNPPAFSEYVATRPVERSELPAPRLVVEPERQPVPPPDALVKVPAPSGTELAPLPRPAGGDLVASGIVEATRPLTAIDLRLPFLTTAADFTTPLVHDRLKQELPLDPAFRIDLFAKNVILGAEQLQAATKAANIPLLVDTVTHDRLAKKQAIATALIVEGLTPTEAIAWLNQLGKSQASSALPNLGAAHLVPLQGNEQRELKELFGLDLGLHRVRTGSVPNSQTGKSIASETIGQITSAIKKTVDKQAILLTYLPPNLRLAPSQSKEVKAYLERRGERKPGTHSFMVVVRPAGN